MYVLMTVDHMSWSFQEDLYQGLRLQLSAVSIKSLHDCALLST